MNGLLRGLAWMAIGQVVQEATRPPAPPPRPLPPPDVQQDRLYAAENEVWTEEALEYPALLLDRLVYERPDLALVNSTCLPTLYFVTPEASKNSFADYNNHRIVLVREWASEAIVVLHEYAHFLVADRFGHGVQGHGAEFAGIMLVLVRAAEQMNYLEHGTAQRLTDAYRRHGVVFYDY